MFLDRDGDLQCTFCEPMSFPLEATAVQALAAAAT